MDILFIATSTYGDAFAAEWQPDLRFTVSFLRRHGIETGFVYQPVLTTPDSLLNAHGAACPGAVFVELSEENREPVLSFLKVFRRAFPAARVLVGGIPATLAADELLRGHPEIDLIVAGEREVTLVEAARCLREGRDLDRVAGLQSRDFRNPAGPLLPDLDVLGPMAEDGVAAMVTRTPEAERTGFLISSRGCYGRCSFCGVPGFYGISAGKAWRGRSPRVVVDDLQRFAEGFGITRFVFQDDNFIGPGNAGQERARGIAREIRRRGLRLHYRLCCRLNDIKIETMRELRDSGLSGIGVSIESANQESLNLFRKGLKANTIYPTLDLLKTLGIPCEVNMIFFDPHLTIAGVQRNLEFINFLCDSDHLSYSDSFPFNELKPFVWSPVASRLRTEGLLDEATFTCRFRDPAVARLALFVRRCRRHVPVVFKKRVLFDALDPLAQATAGLDRYGTLIGLSAGLRDWIGLDLMPRFVAAACDLLEQSGDDANDGLEKLEDCFRREVEGLSALQEALSNSLGPGPINEIERTRCRRNLARH